MPFAILSIVSICYMLLKPVAIFSPAISTIIHGKGISFFFFFFYYFLSFSMPWQYVNLSFQSEGFLSQLCKDDLLFGRLLFLGWYLFLL